MISKSALVPLYMINIESLGLIGKTHNAVSDISHRSSLVVKVTDADRERFTAQ
jgi:hypothetical protein